MMRKKPMLAQSVGDYSRITDKDWEYGMYVQPKLDGVRCLIQQSEYTLSGHGEYPLPIAYSRTGKEWKNIDHILTELKPFFKKYPNVILDGELYNHELKNDFEKIISLVRKTKPTEDDRFESYEKVQFHCYDTIMEHMDFQGRHKFIRDNFGRNSRTYPYPSIRSLMAATVYNTEEVEAYHEGFLEEKYEGSILRQNKPYECKRSWTLMKVKDFSDAEATVIGYEEGKGKREGHLGKFIMQDDDGIEFGCPPGKGYNYRDMRNMLKDIHGYIGARATFTYFQRTKAGSYRHPLFKAIRNYE